MFDSFCDRCRSQCGFAGLVNDGEVAVCICVFQLAVERGNVEDIAVEAALQVLDSVACASADNDCCRITIRIVLHDDSVYAVAGVNSVLAACKDSIGARTGLEVGAGLVAVFVADEDKIFCDVACVECAAERAGEADQLAVVVAVAVALIFVTEQSDHGLVLAVGVFDGDLSLLINAGGSFAAVDSDNAGIFEGQETVLDCVDEIFFDVRHLRIMEHNARAGLQGCIVVLESDVCVGRCIGDDLVCAALAQVDSGRHGAFVNNVVFFKVAANDDRIIAHAAGDVDRAVYVVAVNDNSVALVAEFDCLVARHAFINNCKVLACIVEDDRVVARIFVKQVRFRAFNSGQILSSGFGFEDKVSSRYAEEV